MSRRTRTWDVAAAAAVVALLIVFIPAPADARQVGTAVTGVSDSTRVDAVIGLARTLRDAGRAAEALARFREALALRPDDTALRREVFWVEADTTPVTALTSAAVLLERTPKDAAVRERAIAAAATAGREDLAAGWSREGAARHPGEARWARHEGESAMRRRDMPAAVDAFGRACALGGEVSDRAMFAFALEAASRAPEAWRAWQEVPAAAYGAHQDWRDGLLRTTIAAAPLDEAERAVRARYAGTKAGAGAAVSADETWWALLVERAAKDRRPDRARAAVAPLLQGPSRPRWLRRAADLAADAGDLDAASALLGELARGGTATPDDRWRRVDVDMQRGDRAAAADAAVATGASPCDTRLMTRLAASPNVAILADAALRQPPTCDAWAAWRLRAAHAVLARQDFAAAGALLAPVAASAACAPPRERDAACLDARELHGRVLAWTGDFPAAAAALEALVALDASRVAAFDTLIDAHRATRQHAAAWRAVERRMTLATGDDRARAVWARVALDAGEPARALDLAAAGAPAAGPTLASAAASSSTARERAGTRLLALAALRRDAEAVAACGASAPLAPEEAVACQWATARLAVARNAAGNPAAALALLRTIDPPDFATATLRAQLVADVEGRDAGRRAYAALVASPGATAGTSAALARLEPETAARETILRAGLARFPGDPGLQGELARARLASGDSVEALALARAALASSPSSVDTWVTAIHAAECAPAPLHALLDEMASALGGDVRVLADAAARLGDLAFEPGDLVSSHALQWLDRALAAAPDPAVRLGRARVYAATRTWAAALADTAAVLAAMPDHDEAVKFQAEVLSYAGQYAASIASYDRYLARRPGDLAARRQQARVAGWGQDYGQMRTRYTRILADDPDNSAVQAEFAAKEAFAAGNWPRALTAYQRWLAIEPDDREAAFELAQVEAQRGALSQAGAAFAELATWTPVHREAGIARARFNAARTPSARPYSSWQSSNGYGGQRLLDVGEAGVAARWTPDDGEHVDVTASAAGLDSVASGERWRGAQFRAGLVLRPSATWRLSAGGGVSDVATGSVGLFDVAARWQPNGAWALRVSGTRARWLENAATVSSGLVATTWDAVAEWRGLDTSVDLMGARRRISDGNADWMAGAYVRRRVVRGRDEVALVGWGAWQRFDRTTPAYFSPGGFLRADAGIEWRRWLMRPRFADDLARYISASYKVGLDDRGVVYHHPALAGTWEVHDGLAVEALGDWLWSSVFTQTRVTVQMRLGGAGRR